MNLDVNPVQSNSDNDNRFLLQLISKKKNYYDRIVIKPKKKYDDASSEFRQSEREIKHKLQLDFIVYNLNMISCKLYKMLNNFKAHRCAAQNTITLTQTKQRSKQKGIDNVDAIQANHRTFNHFLIVCNHCALCHSLFTAMKFN